MWIPIFAYVVGILVVIVVLYMLIVITTGSKQCPLGFQVGLDGVCVDVQDQCPPPSHCKRVLRSGLPICIKNSRGQPICEK